jgi:2-dehydropantoate 2-reductase
VKIAVMGTGGVGGYFGGRLAQHGEDVHFIARGAHLRAIQDRGLAVRSYYGDFHINPARVTENPADIGPVDVVMFCVKMWETESAGRAIQPLVGEDTAVISFQNGVDNEEVLARILGSDHVLGGAAYIFTSIAAPGVIEHVGQNARLVFGELDGRSTPRAVAFCAVAKAAGIDASLSSNITKDLWSKFVFICALSGVCTAARSSVGPVVHNPETWQLLVDCMKEVAAVSGARGVALGDDFVERQLVGAQALPPDQKPSMLYDLEHGNRLEVPWLNGTVARLGEELGVPTPVNRFIAAALSLHAGSPDSPAPGRN